MISVGRVDMIPITSIKIGSRARQDLGDLQGLESSMKESGLAQPLAVKSLGNDEYLLLAGERRYTVLLANQVSHVPVRIYEEDLTELEMKIIEKAENFHRKDMEYHELDALILEIHRLEQKEKGAAAPGPGHEAGHTLSDTGEVFGITGASVSTAIRRAEAREVFPELFENCKTQKDASKVLKRMDEAVVKDAIARRIDRDKVGKSTVAKLANSYITGDFFEGVKKIPNSVMHIVEVDSPYAIDLKGVKKGKLVSEDYNEIDPSDYRDFIARVLKECYRVMTDHSWLIWWFGPEPWFETVYNEIINAGFKSTRLVGIWTKPSAQSMSPETRLANSYETFFYAWKGTPVLNKAGRSNIFNFSPVPPQNKTHPTEKPIELMEEIYNTFAFPGSRILIPFLGSGAGLISAYKLGMTGLGFELSKGYRDSFLVRVNSLGEITPSQEV